MKYLKEALNCDQQATRLIERNLIADHSELAEFLKNVNYYKFTGYLYPFREKDGDKIKEDFKDGTTFQFIKEIYDFDVDLRQITFKTIEEIDSALFQSEMVRNFTLKHGPFCYTDWNNFFQLPEKDHEKLLERLNKDIEHNKKEEFVDKYLTTYTSESFLPFWMIAEIASLSNMVYIFNNLPTNVLQPIADRFDFRFHYLQQWSLVISPVRNICAHQSRLWNRGFSVRPRIPDKNFHPEFHKPITVDNTSYFGLLAILHSLSKNISSSSNILESFEKLLIQYPNVPTYKLGFPENWRDYKVFY